MYVKPNTLLLSFVFEEIVVAWTFITFTLYECVYTNVKSITFSLRNFIRLYIVYINVSKIFTSNIMPNISPDVIV